MRYIISTFCALTLSSLGMASAQDIQVTPLDDLLQELEVENGLSLGTATSQAEVSSGVGGDLRILDKLTGEVVNLSLRIDEIAQLGFLSVTMVDCRYPADNPAGDAYTYIEVFDRNENQKLFAGWMLASAPALNAMDHPRYDVWVLRCMTS